MSLLALLAFWAGDPRLDAPSQPLESPHIAVVRALDVPDGAAIDWNVPSAIGSAESDDSKTMYLAGMPGQSAVVKAQVFVAEKKGDTFVIRKRPLGAVTVSWKGTTPPGPSPAPGPGPSPGPSPGPTPGPEPSPGPAPVPTPSEKVESVVMVADEASTKLSPSQREILRKSGAVRKELDAKQVTNYHVTPGTDADRGWSKRLADSKVDGPGVFYIGKKTMRAKPLPQDGKEVLKEAGLAP